MNIGEGSNPVIDLFQNSVSGMIFQFIEKILSLTMPSESSMIFSIRRFIGQDLFEVVSNPQSKASTSLSVGAFACMVQL